MFNRRNCLTFILKMLIQYKTIQKIRSDFGLLHIMVEHERISGDTSPSAIPDNQAIRISAYIPLFIIVYTCIKLHTKLNVKQLI